MSKPFGLNLECIEWHEALILVGVWILAWIIWSLISTGIHAIISKWSLSKLTEVGIILEPEQTDLSKLSTRERCDKFTYTYLFFKPFIFTSKSKIALASLTTWAVAKFLMDLSC